MDALGCQFSAQEADQSESCHAIERMHADLLIGPMEARVPAEEMRVFHLTKSMFDVVLGSISADDLFVSPFVVVGKQKGFAQDCSAQSSNGSLLDLILQFGKALGEGGAQFLSRSADYGNLAELEQALKTAYQTCAAIISRSIQRETGHDDLG